jgi:hypothetical protein
MRLLVIVKMLEAKWRLLDIFGRKMQARVWGKL